MDLILNFKEKLMTGPNPCSPVTAKNYVADIKNFIEWIEQRSNKPFDPSDITIQSIKDYKSCSSLSSSTLERHISSLRKFSHFLSTSYQLPNPFTDAATNKKDEDPWNLKGFKNFLYNYNASSLTIKNYTIDVVQYFRWLSEVSGITKAYEVNDKNIYQYINQDTIEEYKFRLQAIVKLSPSSINRKLSSLRRYVGWAVDEGLLTGNAFTALQNVSRIDDEAGATTYNLDQQQEQSRSIDITLEQELDPTIPDILDEKEKIYSKIPPLRLLQKIVDASLWTLDFIITSPISSMIDKLEYTKWTLTGKNIFTVSKLASNIGKDQIRKKITEPLAFLTPNFKKSFYAPLTISTKWLPTDQKILHYIKHSRPKWYRIYHSYAFVHYMHLGLLILAVSLSGYIAYDNFATSKENLKSVLAGSDYTRMLNYKGHLTDSKGAPITEPTLVKFALYKDAKEKGSALIWQEMHNINPDNNGNFTISLGQLAPLSQSVFLEHEKIYLGIKVGDNKELMPRQQIPTTSYANSSDSIQGLRPITDPLAGEKNTLLALDSLGNLTIGGSSSPIFQATGGVFTISGSTLLLGTNPGTNTDIVITPDGLGKIDLQKPLQNSTEDINNKLTSGAVSVEDNFAIIATSSGKSALYINQNGNGPLISAATDATAKLVLEYGGNLGIGTTGPVEGLFQVADGNDGYGGTIIAKDGGAIFMSSNGTPTLTIGNNTAGKGEVNLRIFPSGEIDYNNSKTAEPKITLPTNKSLYVSGGKGIMIAGNIIPATDGTYNLGSDSLKWNKIYVNEIITNGTNSTFGHMALKDGVVSPSNISNDFTIGGNSTSSAKFQISGSGPSAGSLTTAGTISFSGASPKLIVTSNTRFDIATLGPTDTQPTTKLSLLSNGSLGIGTTTPLFRLDLVDNQNNSSTALITNTSSSANAGVLALKLGSPTPGMNGSYITFLDGNNNAIGSITASNSGGVVYNTMGGDFAEYFKKVSPYEVLLPGDIVCLNNSGAISKCTSVSKSLIGVISGQAGFVGNSRYQNDPNYILVGLIGQLPVAFSEENGEIEPGDPLSIGTNGKATKAISAGQIIGKALEGSKDNSQDKINVYVSLSWYDPAAQLTSTGLLNPSSYNSIEEKNTASGLQLNLLLVKSKSIIATTIETTALSAADISTSTLTIAGKSLNEYILEKIAESLTKLNAQEIKSGVANINSIRTDIISPLSYDSEITLNFRKEVIQIENTKNKKIVAQIDKDGNARFEGSIAAKDASIAGTLRAGKLQADDIDLPESVLTRLKGASTSATYISNTTNIYQPASSSPDTIGTASGSTPSTTSQNQQTLATNTSPSTLPGLGYILASSLSGQLAYVPDLRAKFATFEQGLMSFGPTSVNDISVTGQLSINGSLILADNTINVLGQDLELQPLRQGNLSIMSGRITIDTEGNLNVKGDANFAKNLKVNDTLFTRLISPLANSDLTIRLGKNKNQRNSAFVIENSSGSARFSVDDIGNLISSSSGKFKDIITSNISLVRSAQADTSSIETIATASAGTATINKLQKERTIVSPFVKEDSLIYITATSDTGGLTPYIARQVAELKPREDQSLPAGRQGSFTIQITRPTTKDIKVNWWIIN